MQNQLRHSLLGIVDNFVSQGLLNRSNLEELPNHRNLDTFLNREYTLAKDFVDLYREYEAEKWAPELNKFQSRKLSQILDEKELYKLFHGEDKETFFSLFNEYYYGSHFLVRQLVTDYLARLIDVRLGKNTTFVDLGCGTGATLFPLLTKLANRPSSVFALDLSPSALALVRELGRILSHNVITREINLGRISLEDVQFPEDAVVLTSFSLSCVTRLQDDFFDIIASSRPRAVIHYESLTGITDKSKALSGYLKNRYIEENMYNSNFMALHQDFLSRNKSYRLTHFESDFLGENPIFPASIVIWERNGN